MFENLFCGECKQIQEKFMTGVRWEMNTPNGKTCGDSSQPISKRRFCTNPAIWRLPTIDPIARYDAPQNLDRKIFCQEHVEDESINHNFPHDFVRWQTIDGAQEKCGYEKNISLSATDGTCDFPVTNRRFTLTNDIITNILSPEELFQRLGISDLL